MRSGSGSVRGTGIQSHGLSTLYLGSATALRLAGDWLFGPGTGERGSEERARALILLTHYAVCRWAGADAVRKLKKTKL